MFDRIVAHVEATMRSMSPISRRALGTAVDLVAISLLVPRGRIASDGSAGDRSAGSYSSLGRVRRSVRDVVVVAYFDQPEIKARLGYEPEAWTAPLAAARRAEWADAIDAHDALLMTPDPRPALHE